MGAGSNVTCILSVESWGKGGITSSIKVSRRGKKDVLLVLLIFKVLAIQVFAHAGPSLHRGDTHKNTFSKGGRAGKT